MLPQGDEALPIRVYVDGGRLFVQAEGQTPDRLHSQGDDVFIPDHNTTVRFIFRGDGRQADVLILRQGGVEHRATRAN